MAKQRAKQRNYIFIIYAVIVGALMPGTSRAGIDPVQFFTQGEPKLIQKLEQKQDSGRDVESYVARDRFGNLLRVEVGDPVSMRAEIGGSLLAQGLELPSLPIYPAFVQTGPDGKRLKASVRPRTPEWRNMRSMERLTPLQMGEWLGQMAFNHVLGNPDALTQADHVVLSGQHVLSSDMSRAFRSYERGNRDSLASYLDRIPAEKLADLTEKEATQALLQLNRYISRLEKLATEDITNLFGAYFESASRLRRSKRLPLIDYRVEFQRRIQAVRSEAIAYLSQRYPRLPVTKVLSRAARVGTPVFLLPEFKTGAAARSPRAAPEEILWDRFFQDSAKPSSGEEREISELLERARKREKIYYVGPTVDPEFFDTELNDPPQTHLNPKNSKTLIVVPTNDLEAIEIGRISEVGGAQVMKLDGKKYLHGAKLTPELANQIIERAQRLRVDTVAVVEMPGEPLDVEKVFSKHGLKFVPIDHHESATARRGQPFSSLEQAAQLLGYDLGGMSKVIEVNDRSFVEGLKDLGLTKKAVARLFPPKYSDEAIQRISRFKSKRFGNFFVVRDFTGNFTELASSITIRMWPKPVNVLVLGHQLRFTGNPEFHELLRRTFQAHGGQVKAHVYGGDMARMPFWMLKGIPAKLIQPFNEKAVRQLESVLDPGDLKKFRDFWSSKAEGGSHSFRCVAGRIAAALSSE